MPASRAAWTAIAERSPNAIEELSENHRKILVRGFAMSASLEWTSLGQRVELLCEVPDARFV